MAAAEGFEIPINQESIETLLDLMDNDAGFFLVTMFEANTTCQM